jgi:hypothetical protein
MATLAELTQRFSELERPVGTVLADDVLLSQAIAATLKYSGYGLILSRNDGLTMPMIDADCDLSDSEWAVIRPLFLLYVERENAVYLEASRGLGLDVYGRTVSEVSGDINLFEQELPKLAFSYPVISI